MDGRSDLTPTATIPQSSGGALVPGAGLSSGGLSSAGGSVIQRASPIQSTPLAPVGSRPLAAVGGMKAQGVQTAAASSRPSFSAPKPSYSAPATPSPQLAPQASLRPMASAPSTTASISRPAGAGGWSTNGGTPIVVAQGETAAMLATRYGVPTDALLRANGFNSAGQMQPGARVVIPVYSNNVRAAAAETKHEAAPHREANTRSEPAAAAPKTPPQKIAELPKARETMKFVKGPEPAGKAVESSQKFQKTAEAHPQKAAAVAPVKKADGPAVKPAEKKPQKLAAAEPAVRAEAAVKPEKAAKAERKAETAKAEARPAPKAAPVVDTETTTGTVDPGAKSVADASDKPEFRWPARGRVIQSFKSGANDGINIALPEGTSVKAAEGGTVAYAGSELKGYGNMILIRHPNGYVSAYANNGDIAVKKGDKVTRGQTIAKSGQTGNVASPQLHFELRKGSTPVDPTNYLAGL